MSTESAEQRAARIKAEHAKAAEHKTDQAAEKERLAKVAQAEHDRDAEQHNKPAQTEQDREAEAARSAPVFVNRADADASVREQHEKVDAFAAKRNDENRQGHERNMERIEAEAQEAQARTQHSHDHRANHVPTGKQNNRNTPRVLADGTKVWDQ
jgi:hypothetical protein